MKELKNLAELDEYLKLNFFHIRLLNSDGQTIIGVNGTKKNLQEKKEKIIQYLSSELTTPGVYIIELSNTNYKTKNSERLTYTKGELSKEEVKTIIENSNISEMETRKSGEENFLSYQAALDLNIKCLRLELENEQLKKTIADLEELEEEEEEEAPAPLSETVNQFSWIKELIPTAAGILETHFQMKQKALDIEEKKLSLQNNTQRPQSSDQEINDLLTYFSALKEQQPEIFKKVINEIKGEQAQ